MEATNLFHQQSHQTVRQLYWKTKDPPKNSTESTEYAPSISQPNLSPNFYEKSTQNRWYQKNTELRVTLLPPQKPTPELQNSKNLPTHTLGRPYLVDTPSMESTKFSEHPGASSLRASMSLVFWAEDFLQKFHPEIFGETPQKKEGGVQVGEKL